jgi:hypothetical protein
VLLSTLSEKVILMEGLLGMPYKVWVELKFVELMVCAIKSKVDEVGGGVGGVGEGFDGFLH